MSGILQEAAGQEKELSRVGKSVDVVRFTCCLDDVLDMLSALSLDKEEPKS